MKRFNLLLINKAGEVSHTALKSLSRVFRSNFVFEVPNFEEAKAMLAKLHIDILIVNLDESKTDLVQLSKLYPTTIVMGLTATPSRVDSKIDPDRHKILDIRDFGPSFLTELKGIRKEMQAPERLPERRRQQAPAAASDFKDFFKLTNFNVSHQ